MASNSYFSKQNPTSNSKIPNNLKIQNVINDDVMASVGLYSPEVIEEARFTRFSRFGRVLDPNGKLNDCREYLFFVKPDLHIVVPSNNGSKNNIYKIGVSSGSVDAGNNDTANGLRLNPQLDENSYFRELITSHPNVIRELQNSAPSFNGKSSISPFCNLLSFSVNSYLEMPGSEASTLDNPATVFGTSYEYLKDAEEADENPSFSLEFMDNKYLDTYHFFKAYTEYHIARKSGLVTPPSMDYYRYKKLHNTMGIYKFIVAEDMETIIYYAYFWGVFPTSCPRETFSDPLFSDGLTFSISFKAAFMEDMNPQILKQFNNLMSPILSSNNINKDNWLPVVKQNYQNPQLYAAIYGKPATVLRDVSYDTSTLEKVDVSKGIYPSSMINGELPIAALVDGRQFSQYSGNIASSRPKYKLRWYGIPKETTTNG